MKEDDIMPTGTPTKMKKCSICGDLFLPQKPSSRICPKDHFSNCPVCGKQIIWNTTRKVEPCSKDCRKEATRIMYNQKYGCDHPMQNKDVVAHHKQAMIDKYGVDSPLRSDEIKQRAIQTNRDKFGTDWALGSPEIHDKIKQTMTERYGAPTSMQSKEIREKIEKTMISRYGDNNSMKIESFRKKIEETCLDKYGFSNAMKNKDICMSAIKTRIENYGEFWPKEIDDRAKSTFLSRYGVDNPSHSSELMQKARESCIQKYGVPYGCLVPSAQAHVGRISKINIAFHDKLINNGVDSSFEFYLDGRFFDIALNNERILIEIDPSYTHNCLKNPWGGPGVKINYHRDKSAIAKAAGYRCIHIFDWDDVDRIVDSIKPKKSIYARKCTIYKLKLDVANQFLSKYHFQGTCRGQLLCLGLVQDGELYQVMTFGKPRYDKHHSVELLRLCTKSGYTVAGGASRLFKFATENYGLSDIISYCDLSKFSGHIYETIGMQLIRTTPPQEIWSRGNQKITANLLRQRGYDQLFKTNYGKGTSNEQLMIENGWLPVYDCGQLVYEFR